MMRVLLAVAFVFAAATTLFATAPAALAADTPCAGTLGGNTYPATVTNINGNVVVPDGASCTIYFVNVSGNVQVGRGATLVVNGYNEPSTIAGNVQATQCASALIEGAVMIGGNLQIQFCTGSGPNGFQGPDVMIKGNFLCQGNSSNAAPCLAWLGKVSGNVQIAHNMSATPSDVSLVDISGNLSCQENALAPTHVHGPDWVAGHNSPQDQCAGFATTATAIDQPVAPAASCAALAGLPAGGFPVPDSVITSAVDTPAGGELPERCIVNGYVNQHVSPVDNCTYQDGFQVQLPLSANWNGRFMMEGGGGTEGSVPVATGTIGGTSGILEINNGYAVASQDGGHENSQLAACGKTTEEFSLDPMGVITNGYQSIEVTALTAKYLIDQYYGKDPTRSYWVGCSEGGRQGMTMSQTFPSFFDGVVAGDPVYDTQAVELSEIWSVQQLLSAYNEDASRLPPITYAAGTPPLPPEEPIVYPAFPISDQALFETALMQACDALDGVTDGVIDNLPACQAKFNPATASYIDYAGALGPAGTKYSLQCTGAKNATCLSSAQIQAAMAINQGARSNGNVVHAPAGGVARDHVDNLVFGYAYDGGWMTTVGIPARVIDSATSPPADEGFADEFPYGFLTPPDPTFGAPFGAIAFNFNNPADLSMLTAATAKIEYSTTLNISKFVQYGHKIIWYHGLSDPGPPVLGTIEYYQQMAQQFGGLQTAQKFSRFYPIPNMDHCTGGATTDGFDFLTPLKNWVENGTAPGAVIASSLANAFNATTYQLVGNYITDGFVNAPTTRSRPLCPYPQQARFTGSTTLANGVPVATNPADLANASNYTCINGPPLQVPQ